MENLNNNGTENISVEVIHEQAVLGNQFKIYGTKENPLFLAKDVANWIGHGQASVMLQKVDEDEKVKVNNIHSDNRTGGNGTWFLTENGLYEVLMLSRKPIAKKFKKEVKNILKTIRNTGAYVSSNINDNQFQSLLKTLEQEMYRRIEVEQQLKIYEKAVMKLSEYGIPKSKFGEISQKTGLPKDILVRAYIQSRKTPHASHQNQYIQLLLPLFAAEQNLLENNNA